MLHTTCILLLSLLSSFSPLGTAMLNLTLPGAHPDPEAVAHEVHRYTHCILHTMLIILLELNNVVS